MSLPKLASLGLPSCLLLFGCADLAKDLADDIEGASAAAPFLAISSPVGARSTTAPNALYRAVESNPGTQPELKSFAEQLLDLKKRLEATTEADCLKDISFTFQSGSPSCYGPTLAYLNHPDTPSGGGGSSPPNPFCAVTGTGNGCLPSGDLGIWSPTEGEKGEACTAAKMNSQVASIGRLVNSNVSLMVGMICVAKVQGKLLPGSGEAMDLASALTANIAGASFTEAKVERLPDASDGRAAWRFSLTGKVGGVELKTSLSQAATTENNKVDGRIHGYVDAQNGGQKSRHGFSVVYSLADALFRYELRSAMTATTATEAQLFDASGNYQYTVFGQSGGSSGVGNANYGRAEIDAVRGLGTLYAAWQAGGMDGYTRVFQASTKANGEKEEGVGYFGFGPAITSTEVGAIQGMWCNWAGPGAVKPGPGNTSVSFNSLKVQAQTMERDPAKGIFKPVVSYITYAPTNSCDSPGTAFVYSTTATTNSALAALTGVSVSNNLVEYNSASLGTIPSITAPIF